MLNEFIRDTNNLERQRVCMKVFFLYKRNKSYKNEYNELESLLTTEKNSIVKNCIVTYNPINIPLFTMKLFIFIYHR